jgi:hypothetical protein
VAQVFEQIARQVLHESRILEDHHEGPLGRSEKSAVLGFWLHGAWGCRTAYRASPASRFHPESAARLSRGRNGGGA